MPYDPPRHNFRMFWDYAGGELTNWCVHLIDIVHWALGVDAPLSAASSGGKHHTKDCRDCPDTQEVIWECPVRLQRQLRLEALRELRDHATRDAGDAVH